MSRCLCCNHVFDEDDAWQEFCSPECAQVYVCGRTVAELDPGRRGDRNALEAWEKWLAEPGNARRIRRGRGRAEAPAFGVFVDRVIVRDNLDGTKTRITVRANIGGTLAPRPPTEQDLAVARRWRGHSFSDGHVYNPRVDDLPSVHNLVGLGWFPHD